MSRQSRNSKRRTSLPTSDSTVPENIAPSNVDDPSYILRNVDTSSPSSRKPNACHLPIVKIGNTARGDLNGKYARVHSYYRDRDRYFVTLLHEPAQSYFGCDSSSCDSLLMSWPVTLSTAGSNGLFIPPGSVTLLSALDKATFFLQYVALVLKKPEIAEKVGRVIEVFRKSILPSFRLQSMSIFLSMAGPLILTKWIRSNLDTVYEVADSAGLNLKRVMTVETRPEFFQFPEIETSRGEILTLLFLFIGTNVITQFAIKEHSFVKKKVESMGMSTNFSNREMFESRIDHYFTASKWAKVVLLLSITFMLIAVGAILLALFLPGHSIASALWISWTYVADPGTHADAADNFFIRFISFSITLGGMLIFALMIGIISDGIGEKVDDLKKGKSRVIESNHTLMLGWNNKSLAIIQQIALANDSEGGGTIVVLAELEKEELEGILNAALTSMENSLKLYGTEVVFRGGNPLVEGDLQRVSANTARSVVAMSPDGVDPDEADSNMVRQVMALKAFDEFNSSSCHVVVEVQDVDNKDLFDLVAPDFAEVIVTHDIIGRLMLQCARNPGLASVLESMMGFEGSEFYFEEWPELFGKTFYEITCRFNDAVPIGIRSSDGRVFINPENDRVIVDGDKILVLAEDDDSYQVNDGSYKLCGVGKHSGVYRPVGESIEKIMFCGWRRDMADLITQLDDYVKAGSELWLFNLVPAQERYELLQDKGNKQEMNLKNLTIYNVVGNPIIRRDLNRIHALDNKGKPTGKVICLDELDSILILADAIAMENGSSAMTTDSRSLSSLLIIQDVQERLHEKRKKTDPNARPPCSPISEILDSRTKRLLKVVNCEGYVMSNQIISSVIAQVSEEKDINVVLQEILTAEGSETYIRSASRYINFDNESRPLLSFWDVACRARQMREIAIGYKPVAMRFHEAELLVINPPDKATPRLWEAGDQIITFSMD